MQTKELKTEKLLSRISVTTTSDLVFVKILISGNKVCYYASMYVLVELYAIFHMAINQLAIS